VTGAPPTPPTGGPTAAPGRTGGGGGGATRRKTSGDERWQSWWNLTRELYLGRHHSHALPQSPAVPIATGRGAVPKHDALLPDDVRKSLLPLLAQSLRDDSVEVADSAAIALGRSIPTREAAPILPHLIRNLAHPQSSPQEAALLGLGLCAGKDAVAVLRGVALDTAEGRAACGASGPLDDRLRGLSLLALGLAGTQDALSPIVTVATSATASRELAATAVVAMGLQQEAAPAAIVTLSRMLDERGLDRIVRAQVPIAMARLPRAAARGMLPKLLEVLSDKRAPDEVARSAALAVGKLASIEDGDAVRTMMEVARRHPDAETREFALVALGRIGEQPDAGAAGAEATRTSLHAFLVEQLRHPERRSHQPWAALALGLACRGDVEGKAAASRLELSGRKLMETFEEANDPALQGAIALALGLGRHSGGANLLRSRLAESANPELRGQIAVALGMLRDRDAIEPLRQLVTDPALPPASRIEVARGLALLGDSEFEGRLVELLASAGDSNSAIAYAKALGLVGGAAAAPALRAVAEDRSRPEIQRGFAVVAIGLLAEKSALPWNVRYLVDANFTVPLRSFDAIAELL
jgi:HEAT repeat protein